VAYALVANTSLGSTTSNNVTTASINTSGSTILFVIVADWVGAATTVTDSKTNTWNPRVNQAANDTQVQLYYAINPTVGSGHTFTGTSTGGFPALAVLAFSGGDTSAPFDVQSAGGAGGSVTSVAAGSLTPSAANDVLIAGSAMGTAGVTVSSVDAGFTLLDNLAATANAYGVASAYQIQTTATARNPTFTLSGSTNAAAVLNAFKEAVGAATKAPPPRRQRWRVMRRAA
jgi:hypothetical protein